MCGICGIAHPDPHHQPDAHLLEAMTHSLSHRGPDDSGTAIYPHIGLGHRRLSVIGIAFGHQPMATPDENVIVTYNGEIYNFPAIRAELESEGVQFRTDSDTEILLLGYRHWGMDGLVDRIVGMFAFALWDAADRRLYLVRDRLGVKPLYWAETPRGDLYFASEIRALRHVPELAGEVHAPAAQQFLTFGYILGGDTILSGVRQLAPGSYLAWTPEKGASATIYWDLAAVWSARQAEAPLSDQDYEERFIALLDRCVHERLLSEVPLGAFLSGGLDSSVICAHILEHTTPLKTFSMGFEERSYSELPWAGLVASELGTEHTEATVACEDPDLLLEVAAHLDEPFADTSILPTWVLCREARAHLTVALSGDGGDELLAGYTTNAADKLHRMLRHLPAPLLGLANGITRQLPDSRAKVGTLFKLKQFLAGAQHDACGAHARWRMLFDDASLRETMAPGAWDNARDPIAPFREAYNSAAELNPLDRMLYVDYQTWLANDILVKVDRASMAHGLEVRSPFLDHRLVEFCAGMPPHLKLRGFRGKHVLRKTARGRVPDRVIRRKKAGFNAPVSHWIAGPWHDLVHDTLLGPSTPGLLRKKAVERLLHEHLTEKRDHGYRIFTLLMFALWQQYHGKVM